MSKACGRDEVLVIEDDSAMRDVLRLFLERHGFSVVSTDNVETAMALVATGLPDAVVTDLSMPGGDGLVFVEHLRRHEPRQTPVLVMTGLHPSHELFRAAQRETGVQVMSKPPAFAALGPTVQTMIEEARADRNGRVVAEREPPWDERPNT